MRSSYPPLQPRVPAGQFTFKKQSNPEAALEPGGLVETGMKNQIWTSDAELVSVSRHRKTHHSMLVDLAEHGRVAMNAHLNKLDPDGYIANLNIRRFDGRLRATAVFDAIDFSSVDPGSTSSEYLTDRKAAVYKYLQTTYGVYENGCSEWDNVTLIREINVTHLAHEERRWMTVDTSDVIKAFWAEDGRLSDFRDHIRDMTFVSRLRDHLDRLR